MAQSMRVQPFTTSTKRAPPHTPIPTIVFRRSIRASAEPEASGGAAESKSGGACKLCGVPANEIPAGCNQEGRVAGGLGAVLGFDWWPIKAYKPCGKAVKAGVRYTRKGQITEDIFFGGRTDQRSGK